MKKWDQHIKMLKPYCPSMFYTYIALFYYIHISPLKWI
uniref:Uncharacterized protein n=1 Tax=Lepeophtheirus salmonis TaxID=72036 RepID=A0A0K2U5R2_LEPSM